MACTCLGDLWGGAGGSLPSQQIGSWRLVYLGHANIDQSRREINNPPMSKNLCIFAIYRAAFVPSGQ